MFASQCELFANGIRIFSPAQVCCSAVGSKQSITRKHALQEAKQKGVRESTITVPVGKNRLLQISPAQVCLLGFVRELIGCRHSAVPSEPAAEFVGLPQLRFCSEQTPSRY